MLLSGLSSFPAAKQIGVLMGIDSEVFFLTSARAFSLITSSL